MSSEIHFELVSPEERLISQSVYLAEMPGDAGMFGVMGGHAALVSSLNAGVVTLYSEKGGDAQKIFIAGGFADVTPDNCTVLAEEAVNVKDLNQESLEQYLKDLHEDVELAVEAIDKKHIKEKIALVKAKLVALTGY